MLIRAVAFWAAFSVRAGEPELSGYSGFCDGDIVKDAVVDFSGLSLRGEAGLYYNAVDSLTHETLRGAAGIRRDFVTDPSGLRLTKMEAHGRYLRFDEPVPVTCARDFPVKGDGRRFVSETFDFEGTATVIMTVHPRLIMAPGDTIYNVAERRVMIAGVRVSADSLPTPLSFSTSYFYSDGNRMPVAVVDCTDAPPSSVTAGGTLTRTLSYDIHGWQTGWETPYLSETLHYGESGPSGTTPSYTGLITAKKMYTKKAGGSQINLPETYVYSYDRLGRLTAAKYSSAVRGADFSTTYSYDLQGNMLRLTRKGLTGPRNYGLIDDVTATYTGNQLHTLRDDAPEVLLEASMDVASGMYPSGSFAYDANGNMTRDMSRDITNMEYNALNLPCRATFADGSRIDWLYTATGQKLRQTVIAATGDTLSRRDYLGPYLFVNKELDRYQLAEGYVTPDDDFHAYIPDYQGNIVGVYNTSPNAITSIDSPLEQHTGYYPYGLPFADASNPTANRRKYGAKELTPDLGLNAYDFEARTLTPAFPAFAQPDPLAETYYPLSPYLYCAANPINFVDPTGEKIIADKWSQQGIIDGLSDFQKKYVRFDANGTLDSELLEYCHLTTMNFEDLKTLAKSDYTINVQGVTSVTKKEGTYMMGDDFDSLKKGDTLMPDVQGAESPDDAIHVYTSLNLSAPKRAMNLAHELFSHVAFFLYGKNTLHYSEKNEVIYKNGEYIIQPIPANTPLEIRALQAELEAILNYIKYNMYSSDELN